MNIPTIQTVQVVLARGSKLKEQPYDAQTVFILHATLPASSEQLQYEIKDKR